ncbi:MAG: glycosyltransferase family 25 protein [Pirellulales bacterium]|nr:glycosyltransferase family 25 protein [Pirellulales bacterium]
MTAVSSLQDVFDRAVCINLDRRPDRWEEFQARLANIDWPFAPVKRLRAVDGDQVTSPKWINCGNGAWGCLQSHVRILEDALQDGVTSLLILEDDALFPEDLRQQAERFFCHLPDDWDGLLLGGQHLVRPRFVAEHVVRVHNGNRTHAHAFRGRYIRAAYRHLCNYLEHAKYPQQHVDHRLGNLHLRGDYNIYAPNPWIVGQSKGSSDISGRTENERTWHDSIRVDPLPPKPEDEIVRQKADTIPLVAVAGLYRSGCKPIAGALHHLGGLLSHVNNHFLEDKDLRELCCHFFNEPTISELVPDKVRVQLLRQWLVTRQLEAAKKGCLFAIAKHPLLTMLGRDLLEASHKNIKFIVVERDFEEATDALVKMKWHNFRGREDLAQKALQKAQVKLTAEQDHLLIKYRALRTNPAQEVKRIVDYLGLAPTAEQLQQATSYVHPAVDQAVAGCC